MSVFRFFQPFVRLAAAATSARLLNSSRRTPPRFAHGPFAKLTWGATAFVLSSALYCQNTPPIYLDAEPSSIRQQSEEEIVDPSTSISFPTTLQVQSKLKFPPLTLIGVGVRTVSFLGIKVYSIGFYADLDNPNLRIPKDMPADKKIEHIVQNTSCVIRLVPTRTTNYTHLRDAFMRALQARMALARKQGTLSEEEAQAAGSPMRKLKSLFPNSPLEKHTPLDIYLTAPTPGRPRSLIFRDLGGVENDWVATELVLHYFEGAGPSPLLKQSVVDRLESFSK